MGAAHTTKKEFEPQGPFQPPKPDEAMKGEDTAQEPLAVANDKAGSPESFKGTTQGKDQMARDVAQKFADPNLKHNVGGDDSPSRDEDRRRQATPSGFKDSKQTGYVEMDTEDA